MYKLSTPFMGNQTSVIRTSDGACIPFDIANVDSPPSLTPATTLRSLK